MVCGLCDGPRYVVERSELWTLALNRNQNLLGKSILALNRHCEHVCGLTAEEWACLHPYVATPIGSSQSGLSSVLRLFSTGRGRSCPALPSRSVCYWCSGGKSAPTTNASTKLAFPLSRIW